MALTLPTPKSGKLSSAVALSGTVALNVSVFDTSLHDTLAAMPIGVSSSIGAACVGRTSTRCQPDEEPFGNVSRPAMLFEL